MTEASSRAGGHKTTTGSRNHPAHWDALLSERSILFYDGTYKWDGTDGFWDDTGIHHDFNDPNDPEAYPPTPRPVGSWLEGDQVQVADIPGVDVLSLGSGDDALLEDLKQVPTNCIPVDSFTKFTHEGSKHILTKGNVHKQTLPRDDMFVGHSDRERLLAQFEGTAIEQHVLVDRQNLVEDYKVSGIGTTPTSLPNVNGYVFSAVPDADAEARGPSPNDEATSPTAGKDCSQLTVLAEHVQTKPEDPQAASPVNEAYLAEGSSFDSSPFSGCPSDLSDWGVEDQVKPPYRANTAKIGLKHEDDSKRSTKSKARNGSLHSVADIPVKRRSTRIFLMK